VGSDRQGLVTTHRSEARHDHLDSYQKSKRPAALAGAFQPGDQSMSTTIDRRAVLAGAASLPAISIPALAPACPARYTDPMPHISRNACGRWLAACLLACAVVVIALGVSGVLTRAPVVVVTR